MSKWISVKDRLPEKGERVLAVLYKYDNPENEQIVLVGIRQESLWHDDTISAGTIYSPHKWMPLPNPPEE